MASILNDEKKMERDDKISVIVCTLGRPSLEACLESIYEQSYENLEVIVVSPKVSIKTRLLNHVNPRFKTIRFLLSDKANVSVQRNIGTERALGDIIAFIDDDSVADIDWISSFVKHYGDERVVCVGGKIVPMFSGKVPKELKDLPDGLFRGFMGQTTINSKTSVRIKRPLLWASNISFRKDIFKVVGGFDEELGKTSDKLLCEEEIDMQTKILDKGYRIIYEPKSVVTHIIDSSKLTKDYFIKRSFWQGVSEMIKIRKYGEFQDEVDKLKLSQLGYMNNMKLVELFLELSVTNSLERSVEASYEIGRLVALSRLTKR